jgi:hypothetical protein
MIESEKILVVAARFELTKSFLGNVSALEADARGCIFPT